MVSFPPADPPPVCFTFSSPSVCSSSWGLEVALPFLVPCFFLRFFFHSSVFSAYVMRFFFDVVFSPAAFFFLLGLLSLTSPFLPLFFFFVHSFADFLPPLLLAGRCLSHQSGTPVPFPVRVLHPVLSVSPRFFLPHSWREFPGFCLVNTD